MSGRVERAGPASPPPEAPAANAVVARQGETAGDVAVRHGVEVGELLKANPQVSGTGALKGGTELRLPAHRAQARTVHLALGRSDAYEPAHRPTIFDHKLLGAAGAARDNGFAVRQARGSIAQHSAGSRTGELLFREVPPAASGGATGREDVARPSGQDSRDLVERLRDGSWDVLNVNDAIQRLDSNGDTITIGFGVNASVQGGKGEVSGQIEITRSEEPGQKPQYTVALSGDLAGGLAAEIGQKLGLQSDVQGEFLLGAGGTIEFSFDTPEEAAKAAEILQHQALSAGGVNGAPVLDNLDFFQQHVSALEFKGEAAAQIATSFGILKAGKNLELGGVGGSVSGTHELSVRVELPKTDLKDATYIPLNVTITDEIAIGVSGDAGLGFSYEGTAADGSKREAEGGGVGVAGNVEAKLTNTWSLEVQIAKPTQAADPTSVACGMLMGGDMQSLTSTKLGEITESHTLSVKGDWGAPSAGGGVEVQIKIDGAFDEATRTEGFAKLAKGDIEGYLQTLGDNVAVEWQAETYQASGIDISPEAKVMGYGAGIEFQYMREDHGSPSGGRTTATQAYDEIMRFFASESGRR
ncbi:MAG: LysM domain-containing protein [Acidobacteriota bacterium]